MEPITPVRRACRVYAQKYLDLQRSQFERLGVLAAFAARTPPCRRATSPRLSKPFSNSLKKALSTRASKPVYWCIHDRTALAEAEVEYELAHQPEHLRPLSAHQSPTGDRCPDDGQTGFHHHLDNHALDPARLPGRGLSPRSRIRSVGTGGTGLHRGRSPRGGHSRGMRPDGRRERSPASPVRSSKGSASNTLFSTASYPAFWAPT